MPSQADEIYRDTQRAMNYKSDLERRGLGQTDRHEVLDCPKTVTDGGCQGQEGGSHDLQDHCHLIYSDPSACHHRDWQHHDAHSDSE